MRRCLVSCITTFLILFFGMIFLGWCIEKEAEEPTNALTCLSNMKELAQGIQMYALDYDERNIRGLEDRITNKYGQVGMASWQYEVMPYIKSLGPFTCPDAVNPVYWGETSPSPNPKISYQFRSSIGLNWYMPKAGSAVGNAEGATFGFAGWWGSTLVLTCINPNNYV